MYLVLVWVVPMLSVIVCVSGLSSCLVSLVEEACCSWLGGGTVDVCGVDSLGSIVLLSMCALCDMHQGWKMQVGG